MVSMEQIFNAVLRGNAICFLGAGFSNNATDAYGEKVPSTAALTSELKSLANIDESEEASLSDIAEFFNSTAEIKPQLNLHLQRRLTVTKPTQIQELVAKLPWRAVFSTNFDDIFERTSSQTKYYPISPTSDEITPPTGLTPLYYLHGRALDLVEKTIDPMFVISESNYLDISDKNKNLYQRFLNEVHIAEALVFFGYSLKDLEIAKNLISTSPSTSEKTLIITSPKDGIIATSRLKKYGNVLPIGTEGFVSEIDNIEHPREILSPEILSTLKIISNSKELTEEDLMTLILRGSTDIDVLASQMSNPSNDSVYVVRDKSLDKLTNNENDANQFIVISDLSNGKTVFLDEASVKLHLQGFDVYRIETNIREVEDDIDIIISSKRKIAFIVDDAIRYRSMIEYISKKLPRNCLLICSLRADKEDRLFDDITGRLSGKYCILDINALEESELTQWDNILERWGYWEERISLPADKRVAFLRESCAAENRSVILSVFSTSKVADKISELVRFFLSDDDRKVAFSAMLISSLCQQHVPWDRIVNWLEIDENRLKSDIAESTLSSLFQTRTRWNIFTSPQLAAYILRNHFLSSDRDVLLEVYTDVVLSTAESASDGYLGQDSGENLKELMKFRFLMRLFGDDDNASQLIASVYKRLSKARYIRDNPQFWLQYAMSRMEISDLVSAETYLKTALGLAEKRGKNYSPFQILDQRARLYLLKNTVSGNSYNITEINLAIRDLIELSLADRYDIVYPFRSISKIEDFLECHIDNLDQSTKSLLNTLFSRFGAVAAETAKLPKSVKGETQNLYASLDRAKIVLTAG